MLRNILRWSALTFFDMTAGLAFVVIVVSLVALIQVVMHSSLVDKDFTVNFAVWTIFIAAGIGWIYYFSTIRDRVRAFILKVV
jgi:hypothetical protein